LFIFVSTYEISVCVLCVCVMCDVWVSVVCV